MIALCDNPLDANKVSNRLRTKIEILPSYLSTSAIWSYLSTSDISRFLINWLSLSLPLSLCLSSLLHSCLLHLSVGCLCCGIWKRNALKYDGRQPRSSLWPGITRANTLYLRTQMARFARGPPSRCQSPSPKFVRMVSEAKLSLSLSPSLNMINNWTSWYSENQQGWQCRKM